MRRFIALCILAASAACGVTSQPASIETVAAYEIPLPTSEERLEFLAILRKAAAAEGAHVDAASDEQLQRTADVSPPAKMTIHAAVWHGSGDNESWATILDQADHLGQVWIMFSRGEDHALASRFREQAMRGIRARWPDTLSLPIIDRSGIPLRSDLERTPAGYRLSPSAVLKYGRTD